jgi:hypothetical protein
MDSFGNKKPVPIEVGEWWFNGRIIQQQDHPLLPKYVSFPDNEESYKTEIHSTFREAVKYCKDNPCVTTRRPSDYL